MKIALPSLKFLEQIYLVEKSRDTKTFSRENIVEIKRFRSELLVFVEILKHCILYPSPHNRKKCRTFLNFSTDAIFTCRDALERLCRSTNFSALLLTKN